MNAPCHVWCLATRLLRHHAAGGPVVCGDAARWCWDLLRCRCMRSGGTRGTASPPLGACASGVARRRSAPDDPRVPCGRGRAIRHRRRRARQWQRRWGMVAGSRRSRPERSRRHLPPIVTRGAPRSRAPPRRARCGPRPLLPGTPVSSRGRRTFGSCCAATPLSRAQTHRAARPRSRPTRRGRGVPCRHWVAWFRRGRGCT
mmetsp:Transcript_24034/g.63483  ORF Transcript_24034/g.63483 Transcript_24034/m.63483 type:complete len:201 (-) Transcript_24034:997-1599(-)|eukprot:4107605-Prymnesium_polylepis.1